ncbi:hypothetical protein NC652_023100 [Populus alba x Populus x berolinensis]|nr:hypothetical protein NC652_023100 [Populus alba x Populus x berolinensis]
MISPLFIAKHQITENDHQKIIFRAPLASLGRCSQYNPISNGHGDNKLKGDISS